MRTPHQRFLSTLSLRRATLEIDFHPAWMLLISIHALLAESDQQSQHQRKNKDDFYPRSPCGERLGLSYFYIIKITISIHALLAESDGVINRNSNFKQKFLSTLSLRRATRYKKHRLQCNFNFYPRSPCGERPIFLTIHREQRTISIHALLAESDVEGDRFFYYADKFLSTLSLRRATE